MDSKTAADDATERKKALLVYKSNLQSVSDDDDEASDDEDSASLQSDAVVSPFFSRSDDRNMEAPGSLAVEENDEGEEGGVQVEKDDDEFLNVPSDDDLDSTATPRRSETDEDDEDLLKSADFSSALSSRLYKGENQKKTHGHSETDSASEKAVIYVPSPSPSNNVDDSTPLKLKSGTSNVGAIIATRRRTVARKECEVCHEPRNGRRALLCQQCKCMYHSSCFRRQHPKLVPSTTRQWSCPDCEPAATISTTDKSPGSTPSKQRSDSSAKNRSSRSAKSSFTIRGKSEGDERSGTAGDGNSPASEIEIQRVTDLALRGGNNINTTILDQTGEMLVITQNLSRELIDVMGPYWLGNARDLRHDKSDKNGDERLSTNNNDVKCEQQQQQQQDTGTPPPPPPPFLLVPTSSLAHASTAASSQIVATNDGIATAIIKASDKDHLLRRVYNDLDTLKRLLEQLQVAGIQFEIDLIKEIKAIPNQDCKTASSGSKKQGTGTAGRSASGSKGKSGASRLYSSKQIQKLEEWYQRSSRPESSEIHSMYRIINCPDYADSELQPEGISVKQIRIWFDNRRAKERLDYMRLKMKDISTTDMDADSVKKMKAAYIDEAKEVLEARVSRMRDNGQGSSNVVDEADMALIANIADHPIHGRTMNSILSETGNKTTILEGTSKDGSEKPSVSGGPSASKKRIRIDYVASVRKAIKDARDAGKNEEEMKALRTAAIERARERLHVPFKNARTGPFKPLGKEELSHIKMKLLKLLEEDAPAEELTDIIELLLSLLIPRAVLIESDMQRQLDLVLLAHKDNKELVRQTKKLQEEFRSTVENGDIPSVMTASAEDRNSKKRRKEKARSLLLNLDTESLPGTPVSSPNSGPTPSPESRRPRVKFSLAQLVKLEKYFHKEDTPSKKKLDKIAARLNGIASSDPSSDVAQRSIDYKQIRCWFYKRRSANQPPQALSGADLHINDVASSSSSSSDTESDNDSKSDKVSKSRSKSKPKAQNQILGAKRKALESDDKTCIKRYKQENFNAQSVENDLATTESTSLLSMKSDEGFTSSTQAGRFFNVKQLATIIEEYEKNPRPTAARLEELQKVLNRDDHTDEHSVDELGVTKQEIKMWFSNRRAKERLDLINMKIKETRAGILLSACSESEGDENESHVSPPARDAFGARQPFLTPEEAKE
ncbi:ptype atpase [Plasmopara halstedii]|uniref:Ptype atpase n=1 Tax=Plasmopara halstedii TaxID=4781 RepID=A0A0P1AL71_PLAHL|nr:ptype atpase [Plasmopara halstedii]CEG42036.1 ptype atpase [Plasmopara halstedii]|eukprot:XP_024578405.1 ptype atpase [Plasmopara halstedii]